MDIDMMYKDIMSVFAPILTLSGLLAFTISMIVMLINMIIGSATGKGLHIGVK